MMESVTPATVGLPPHEMVLRWLPLDAGVDMESCRDTTSVVLSGVVLSGAAAGRGGGAMRGVLGVLALCAHTPRAL